MTALPLTLPSWRPARITAEVLVDKHGSPTYYVWADKARVIDQGIERTPELAAQHVRDEWKVEPVIKHRKGARDAVG